MKKFTQVELKLKKNVTKGEKESLLSLFDAIERFKPMAILTDMEEGWEVKVVMEGLADVVLKLGNDMEKGQTKTMMTLFWFKERSTLFNINGDAQRGDNIQITMWANT